jgi:hypothetical protein
VPDTPPSLPLDDVAGGGGIVPFTAAFVAFGVDAGCEEGEEGLVSSWLVFEGGWKML